MNYTVYIDVVFAVNTLMDVAVLLLVRKFLGIRAGWGSILLAAAAGGLWAGLVSILPGLPAWARVTGTYGLTAGAMAWIGFRPKTIRQLLRQIGGMYLASALLGGVITALYQHTRAGYYLELLIRGERIQGLPGPWWLLLTAAGCLGAWSLAGLGREFIRDRLEQTKYCPVVLEYQGKASSMMGLLDTGNCLREPITGRPAHVVTADVMRQLCQTVNGVIYIPYQAVGTSSGVLPAVFLDWMEVELHHKRYRFQKPLVAVSREALSPTGKYQILLQQEQWQEDHASYDKCSQHTGGKFP